MSNSKLKNLNNNGFMRVLIREIGRITGSKASIFLTLIGPMLSFLLLINVFYAGVPNDLHIAVVDKDFSTMSRQLTRMVDATRMAHVADRLTSLEEGKEAVLSGRAEAIIYIPSEFEKSVLKGEGAAVQLYINNTNVLVGGLLKSAIYRVLTTYSTGVKLQVAMKQGLPLEQAMGQVHAVNMDSHVLFNPYTNYSYFLVTALMPMLVVLFTLLGAIYAIGIEIRKGTSPQWLKLADHSIMVALAAKLLPYIFFMLINVAGMHFIMTQHLGFPLRGYWGAIMLSQFLMILAYQMVAVMLLALTANTRLSLSLGSAYSMMALTFSGLAYPVFGMPLFARILAHLFPFYHWMEVFMGQGMRGEPLEQTIWPMASLLLFVLAGLFFIPRLKGVLSDARFQHRY
ncbi:ABC-2 type transport system permease protein [Saccharicrinis carchari]|uniref:ABC-2 type transport system permease protein n=1 Tax=Saccharicrinis carchari TaxID=1168039 RepID=A0A521DDP2_SACCC|nr:ABC transporter permease [Saccharicrinis carchari]SMO69924.1 ABC-2 type transport system permease protein [Saccharicrinis carchari]